MFDTQLMAIKDANPDVLFLASFAPEVPLIMKQAREMGHRNPSLLAAMVGMIH